MLRGQRTKLSLYDDVWNLNWYQKLYFDIVCYKANKRYRKFCENYKRFIKNES